MRGAGSERLVGRFVADIQRSRLLAAAVKTVEELGYADATVAHITSRARVSRRTFYELFVNRETCLAAMLDEVVGLIAAEVKAAVAQAAVESETGGLAWRGRIRAGLAAILQFLDREPGVARACIVELARGGPLVLERREAIFDRLAAALDEGHEGSARGAQQGALTAEGLVGAAHAIVYARVLRGERAPLSGLVGELMSMIVLPYLGPAAARREQAGRGTRAAAGRVSGTAARVAEDPLDGVAMRLTYRTARVLECVAELSAQGSDPSNREVADHAGIVDAGQVSKLLARLQRLGLLANRGQGARAKGEPNAWALTPRGRQVTQSIRGHLGNNEGRERNHERS